MRFALDILFLDEDRRVVRSETATPPRQLLFCRRATSVLELAHSRDRT
jgi:uncharacterized membrane protein (UPF0127 family)